MNTHPLVTVIIPTYNYRHYIGEAIDSILNSDFPTEQTEIIVIDDGSSDDTEAVMHPYLEEHGDRIQYLYQENQGKAWATRVGIEKAKGKYLFNLDADDYFLPEKISKVVQIFEANPEVVHVGHPALCWNVEQDDKLPEPIPTAILNQRLTGTEMLSYFYRNGILFGGGSTFAARVSALRTFEIPKSVDMYIDEYLILATLSAGESYLLDDVLSIWRIHQRNFSKGKSVHNKKWQRSLASVEGVCEAVQQLDITPEIQEIYRLKSFGLMLAVKEKMNQKSLRDIAALGHRMVKSSSLLGWETVGISKRLHLFNRMLPTGVLQTLKSLTA